MISCYTYIKVKQKVEACLFGLPSLSYKTKEGLVNLTIYIIKQFGPILTGG